MDIQAINLPKLLLMPVHPLNPPPAWDSGLPHLWYTYVLLWITSRHGQT